MVTISASYGAGGWLVGPQVADRLGVGFLDQAIPPAVAADLGVPVGEIAATEDDLGGGLSHWLGFFSGAGAAWVAMPLPEGTWHYDEHSYKQHVRAVLEREAERGAVILGRCGAIVLSDDPRALHVRLDGPKERRIAQAMDLGGIDEHTARRAQQQTDTARLRYSHRLYHADVSDHRHYHLYLDATAVPLATCVELIVTAVRGCGQLRQLRNV